MVDDEGRCLACGRHFSGSWKDNTYDLNHKERQHYATRAQRLLSNYKNLIELNSCAGQFVIADIESTVAQLNRLESQRIQRYCDTSKEKSPEEIAFEAYWTETRESGHQQVSQDADSLVVDLVNESSDEAPVVVVDTI